MAEDGGSTKPPIDFAAEERRENRRWRVAVIVSEIVGAIFGSFFGNLVRKGHDEWDPSYSAYDQNRAARFNLWFARSIRFVVSLISDAPSTVIRLLLSPFTILAGRYPKQARVVAIVLLATPFLIAGGFFLSGQVMQQMRQAESSRRFAASSATSEAEERLRQESVTATYSALMDDTRFYETRAKAFGIESGPVSLLADPSGTPGGAAAGSERSIFFDPVQTIEVDADANPPEVAFDLVLHNTDREPHDIGLELGFTVDVRKPGADDFHPEPVRREVEFEVRPDADPGARKPETVALQASGSEDTLRVGNSARFAWSPGPGSSLRNPRDFSVEYLTLDGLPVRDPRSILGQINVEVSLAKPPLVDQGDDSSALRCNIAIGNRDRRGHGVRLGFYYKYDSDEAPRYGGFLADDVYLDVFIPAGATGSGPGNAKSILFEMDLPADLVSTVEVVRVDVLILDKTAAGADEETRTGVFRPTPNECNYAAP